MARGLKIKPGGMTEIPSRVVKILADSELTPSFFVFPFFEETELSLFFPLCDDCDCKVGTFLHAWTHIEISKHSNLSVMH
jgi:hypothetical protein